MAENSEPGNDDGAAAGSALDAPAQGEHTEPAVQARRRPTKRMPRGAGDRTRKSEKAKAVAVPASDDADGKDTLFAAVAELLESAPRAEDDGDEAPADDGRSRADDTATDTAADDTDDDTAVDDTATDTAVDDTDDADTDDAATGDADDEADGATPAPFASAFGLLFQAPQPLPRRASRPAGVAVSTPAGEDAQEADRAQPQRRPDRDEAEDSEGSPDEGESAEAATGRSRRRRGGRGRRTRGEGETMESPAEPTRAESEESEAAAETSPDTEPADDEDDASGPRRRRRRRRSTGAVEGEDPPGTVTKVRDARRDEPQAVKGSTRLEAKKLRRREGREAGRRRTIITEKEFLARRESVERTMVVRRLDGRTQIAVLEDGILVEHYVSRTTNASMAGNVYLGRVQNVLPSMEAAFVDVGRGRNAVLYAGEVNWDTAGLTNGEPRRIENVLSSGESVLVQVTKDPIGHKGARLTSQISLPGRYLVYVPEGNMTGISRKLPDTERSRLKAILREVVPADAGVIVRTAAEGASEEELRRDVERLARTWEKIATAATKAGKKKAAAGGAPTLLYAEPDLTVRVIRDVFNEDFASLVIAGDEVWKEISGYVGDVAPDLAARMTKWTGEQDIFTAHRIDEQLAKALDRKVYLPSGGSLVIDRTEAMTVVDVNTGRFVGSGGNLEETVTKNNLEAAEEIVRQLRLRDIGGIIVIDFIDMVLESNRDLVVRRLLECLGRDRTKHQVAEVTSLGLVQMTRKRVASGLLEVFSETCEHCEGRGIIVRTAPVEKSAAPAGNDQPAGSPGRGRRGKPASEPAAPEPPKGPTAAQIAAAAHAAAVKSLNRVEIPVPAEPGLDESGPETPETETPETLTADVPDTEPAAAGVDAGEFAPGDPDPVDLDSVALATGRIDAEAHPGDNPPIDTPPTDSTPPTAAPPSQAPPDQSPASTGAMSAGAMSAAGPEPTAQDNGGRGRGRRRRGRATAPAGPPPAPADGES